MHLFPTLYKNFKEKEDFSFEKGFPPRAELSSLGGKKLSEDL